MKWNWQRSDWPNFSWDANRLRKAEAHFLIGSGTFAGTVRRLGTGDREQLTIEAISLEAIATCEIEGEIFDRASVESPREARLFRKLHRRRHLIL